MFSEKIEEVIKASLIDGVITEKERQVIKRLAVAEGIDEDTVDVLLDARIQELNKQKKAERGVCPYCGAVLESFSTVCPACGEEIRQKKTSSSMKELNAKLENVTDLDRRRSIVTSFPVPNTREDLLEFLSLSAPNAKKAGTFFDTPVWRFCLIIVCFWIPCTLLLMVPDDNNPAKLFGEAVIGGFFVGLVIGGFFAYKYAKKGGSKLVKMHNEMRSVWHSKFEQVMTKARLTLHKPEDVATLNRLQQEVNGK